MAKKSDAAKANKSHKAHSSKQGRTQKPSRGERPDKAGGRTQKPGRGERPDKAGGRQKKAREIKPSSGNDNAFDGIEKLAGGKKSKDGCLPKVFMLLLPFMAVGVYFFLKS
ncbi:MAG: hypothetical protein QY332_05795 [Anaerolineales bacterium]|nr:MAG: hypothetical protein QY332_05795 [Anaerolineales bacterium]